MNPIWLMIKDALTSKKFVVTVAGVIAATALKVGLDLPVEDVATILSPVVAYIFAQGWADKGKEAAKAAVIANVIAESPSKTVAQKVDAIKTA